MAAKRELINFIISHPKDFKIPYLSEDEQKKLIGGNYNLYNYLKNPSLEVSKEFINEKWGLIDFIKNPSRELQEYACDLDIDEHSPDLRLYINKNLDDDLLLKMLKKRHDKFNLKIDLLPRITLEMEKYLVELLLQYGPGENKLDRLSEKSLLYLISQDPNFIFSLKEPTKEMVNIALEKFKNEEPMKKMVEGLYVDITKQDYNFVGEIINFYERWHGKKILK